MKSIFTTFLILSFTLIKAQNVGINNANLTPDPSAGLDVNYTDKGVLIPRVALTGTNDVTTVPGAATSLLVYNTATVNDVTPGYYYWDGTQWLRLLNTGNAGGMEWLLTGNAGTTAGTNFLGTTVAQDLVFKTNNTENMRITNTNGYVGIGTPSPTTTLQLNNNIYFDEGNGNIAVNPDIRFDLQGLISADNNLYLNFDGTNNSGTQALYIGYASQTSSATNAMTILDNGNTGIGTTTPTSKLQVVDRYDTTQTLTPFNSLSDRLPGVSVYDNTDFIGITTVDKDNNLSTTNDADGMIYWGDDNNDQDLRFTFMRWNGTRLVPTDHMAIKANGNVGIGISTPGIRLQVDDSSSATTYIGVSGKLSGNSCVGYRWINRNPSEGSWTAYFGGPVGFSGVQPRAWEIWEYPNDGNYCCRTRFRIQSTYGLAWTSSLVPVYIDVNNQLWAYGYNTISDENLKENIK
ncbi:MAG TPA: hypothetical protein DIU39_03755, partial [Flavobacteriales bacterium]|nr:hypothetical protein [Flavobacteriales bacterium]